MSSDISNDDSLRIRMFVYHFKHKSNPDKFPYKSGAQWKRGLGGRGRAAIQFSTTLKGHKKYDPPNEKELTRIIQLLEEDFPAKQLAEKSLRGNDT